MESRIAAAAGGGGNTYTRVFRHRLFPSAHQQEQQQRQHLGRLYIYETAVTATNKVGIQVALHRSDPGRLRGS